MAAQGRRVLALRDGSVLCSLLTGCRCRLAEQLGRPNAVLVSNAFPMAD